MKTLRRRLGCLLLSAVLLLSTIPVAFAAPTPGLSNFKRVNNYTAGTFSDVPEGEWYTPSIKAAYEYGLAMGSYGKFDRTSNMTAATAITLAARLHAIYHTGSTAALVQGNPWYQVYVDYALTNGIITAGQFTDYNADVTRAQCAVLLSKAVPAAELPAINTVEDGTIPDIPADAPYYDDIYALYRAGIVIGNDDKGTFTPDEPINRATFFTIATRIVDKTLRKNVTLTVALTGIQTKSSMWLFPGDTYQLSATPVPTNAKLPSVTWTSADTKVATVSSTGLVTMVAPGKTTVTVKTPGGFTASCTVNVMKRAVEGVTLDQTSVNTYPGQSVQLKATINPANATDQTLTWTSSNPKVATVSATGLVTTVAPGTATITAKTSNGTKATCAVTVNETKWYSDGTYLVGTDIPAGDYYAVSAHANVLGYYAVCSDAALTNWLADGLVDTHSFFRVYAGEYLELLDCNITAAECAPAFKPDTDGYYGEGVYRVGIDIPAGDYYVAPLSSNNNGFCEIYQDITQKIYLGSSESGSYIRAESGNLLSIRNGKIIPADLLPKPEPDANGNYGAGGYRVGIDIPSGVYSFSPVSQRNDGSFVVYKNLTGDRVDSNSFGSSITRTLKYGQYIEVHNATFTCVQSFGFEPDLVIGHLVDLTGIEKSTGILAQQAVDFAVAQINANGGIGGRMVTAEHYDCQSSSLRAADGVKTLVEENGVNIILAPLQAGHKEQAAKAAAQYGVPLLAYDETPRQLTSIYENLVSAGGSTVQLPTVMADYLYHDAGLRKIYCIAPDTALGRAYMEPFIRNFEALGGTVIEDIRVPRDAMDISWYLVKMNEDADAIVSWLQGAQGINLWCSWYDTALSNKMPLYAATGRSFTDYFIWNALNNARPEVIAEAMEWGVYAPVFWSYSVENESTAALVQQWQAEFGAAPDSFGMAGRTYSALLLLKNAMESIDGEPTDEAILAALKAASCTGPDGETSFNGTNVATKDVYIAKVVQLADGSFNYEVVDTYTAVPPSGLHIAGTPSLADDVVWESQTAVSLLFNTSDESVCQNADLRKAICYAIDNAAIVTALAEDGDQAAPIYGIHPFLPGSPREWSTGRSYYDTDPSQVQDLLNQAGYDGQTIEIVCFPQLETAAIVLVGMLQSQNINCEVMMLDRSSYKVFCEDPSTWSIRLDIMDRNTSLPEFFRTLLDAEKDWESTMATDLELDTMLAQWEADPSNTQLQERFDNRFTFEQCYGYGLYSYFLPLS